MRLLKRKITETSFIISIESGVEEIQDAKEHEECDFLVDMLTGKDSLSTDFCCKMLYMIFCTCFQADSKRMPGQRRLQQLQHPQFTCRTI